MWPQNKMQDGKIHNKNDWQFNTLLGSATLAIFVLHRAIPITRHFEDVPWQYDQWQPPSQIQLVFCSPTSGLYSCNCSTEWPEIPPWYSNLMFGLYHIRNSGCMGVDGVEQKVWNMIGAGRSTWVAKGCQSWQRHLSSWCYSETWLGKISEVSQLRVIFWFNSLHSSGIHGRAFNLSHLHSLLNSFGISSQHPVLLNWNWAHSGGDFKEGQCTRLSLVDDWRHYCRCSWLKRRGAASIGCEQAVIPQKTVQTFTFPFDAQLLFRQIWV